MSELYQELATISDPEARRALVQVRVSELALQGIPNYEIAERLGLTEQYVQMTMDRLKDEWLNKALGDTSKLIGNELSHLENIRALAYQQFHESRISRVERVRAGRDQRDPRPDQVGDPKYLQLIIQVGERICRLLGLDAAQVTKLQIDSETNYDIKVLMTHDIGELARMHGEALAAAAIAQPKPAVAAIGARSSR